VSVPQASGDLSTYQKLAPTNLRYDSSVKRYVATEEFSPLFLKLNGDRYLVQLKAISDGVIALGDTWIEAAPPSGVVPLLNRKIDPHLLKKLIATIKEKKSIEVQYQSMFASPDEDVWRRITPHAFGFDGLRWHVRAFCHRGNKFRDFIVSRCMGLRNLGETGVSPQDDVDWNTNFEVLLKPNPVLSEAQQKAIEIDYGMIEGIVAVSVRCALLYYFEKRLRLDVGEIDTPEQTPVVIKNIKEFKEMALRVSERLNLTSPKRS